MKLILAAAIVTSVQGFYLPGVSPTDYSDGDDVPVWVNALSSDKTVSAQGREG